METIKMVRITEHMRMAGITPKLLKSKKMIRCPRCNYEFNLMYSRAIACQGCPSAVYGCNLVRCPRCDHEFPLIKSGLARTKSSARSLDNYMAKIISDYYRNFGKSPRR
jgi:uncharacterized C2H2 Zn-finger protein